MASLVGLYNNPSIGVPNNGNNSSRTALAEDQITLLEGNNSGSALTGGQVNPLGNNNANVRVGTHGRLRYDHSELTGRAYGP
jgi:hypothetical protein